jgi:8-oxo-dGTP diphosphatase
VEHDGNGWVHCGQGHRHWGRFGAAGLLLRRTRVSGSAGLDRGGAMEVLLQHRAAWTADGDTWGLPGGARDSHESAVQAALREAGEEAGIEGPAVAVVDELIDDHGGGWSYTTVLARLVVPVVLVPQEESEELRWVPVDRVDGFALHQGFARTWPRLRSRLDRLV